MKIIVHGLPAAQGSKRYLGNGRMIESSKAVKPWREAVKWAALEAVRLTIDEHGVRPIRADQFTGPVRVDAVFTFTRPKSHYRTGKHAAELRDDAPSYVATKPDLDKIIRSTLDALTDAGIWRDDNQVAGLYAIKVYGDTAGAVLTISPLTGDGPRDHTPWRADEVGAA